MMLQKYNFFSTDKPLTIKNNPPQPKRILHTPELGCFAFRLQMLPLTDDRVIARCEPSAQNDLRGERSSLLCRGYRRRDTRNTHCRYRDGRPSSSCSGN